MRFEHFGLLLQTLLAASIGCSDRATRTIPEPGEPITHQPDPPAHVSPSPAPTSGTIERTEDSQLDISYFTDDFFAAFFLQPKQMLQSSSVQRAVDVWLNEIADDLPIDPRSLEQVDMLVAPPTQSELSLLFDERDVDGNPTNETDQASQQALNEAAIGPSLDGHPQLDHLFVGLRPEPDEKLVHRRIPLPSDPSELDLTFVIPPFIALVLRFSEPGSADGFVTRLTKTYNFGDAFVDNKIYLRQQLPADSEQRNPFAILQKNDRTIVLASEQTLRKMLAAKNVRNPLVDRSGSWNRAEQAAFGVATLEPFRELGEIFIHRMLVDAVTPLNDGPLLTEFFDQTVAMHFAADLQQETLVEIFLESHEGGSIDELTKLIQHAINLTKQLLENSLDQAASADNQPLMELMSELLQRTTAQREGERLAVRVDRPPGFDASLKSLVEWSQSWTRQYRMKRCLGRIGVAMLTYFDVYGRLPDNSTVGIFKHPVSWRVKILPYMSEAELFHQYRYEEPWDSEHNLQILQHMPTCYGSEGTKTSIMTFNGPDSPFHGPPITLDDITDGLTKTIFAVRAAEEKSVPWSKPVDLPMNIENPAAPLGDIPAEGFDAIFFDGRVSTLPQKIDAETLWRLINPSDGKRIENEY